MQPLVNEPLINDHIARVGISGVALADFLDTLKDGVAVIDGDMRLKYYNDSLIRMLGLRAGDIAVGGSLRELMMMLGRRGMLGPLHGQSVTQQVEERLAQWGTPESQVERRHMKNGRLLDIYRSPTSDGDIISIHVDVTENVRNAEEIERQRLYMISLLENTTDGIALLDRNGRFVMYNDRLLELYDVDPKTVHWGMDYNDFAQHFGDLAHLSPAERETEIANRYRFAFDPDIQNIHRKLISGRTLSITKRNLPDGGCVMTYRDVTQDLARERALIESRIRAEESSRHKSEFVARMSHEMRTPLNGVLGVAALLERAELGENERELVNVISNSGKVLLRLIDDILDLSKLDADSFEVVNEDFEMEKVIHDCVATVAPSAAEKDLELRIKAPPAPMPRLRGDMVRIKQILLNLLTNAVKFTEEGHVEISQDFQTGPEGVTLSISVSDTGVGIAEEKLDQIFNRFYQIDSTVTRKYGGAGLGLAITQKLVDTMGGAIQVASEQGKGSTFRIRLTLPSAKGSGKV